MKYQPYQTVFAHSTNLGVLHAMMRNLKSHPDSPDHIIPPAVFLAFTIEGYLNTLGCEVIPRWTELERLPWKTKITLLHSFAGATPDWSRPPLQFATRIFKIRDHLAHGKPETTRGPCFDLREDAAAYMEEGSFQPKWYTELNKAWINDAYRNLSNLLGYLSELHGFNGEYHLMSAIGGIDDLE
ncbi:MULTISPECIES: hypothetical protein [unclassified Pseudomonas]|uniref:hypothetical protein n=1 Tax=unclassified Pseudomonas TaxID=196821 RepID=UPI0030D724B0